jgi:hypothetical protein
MLCCDNCFVSPTLKDHINSKGFISDCDFCSSKGLKCIEPLHLFHCFKCMFSLYREVQYGIDYFEGDEPIDNGESIFELIEDTWHPIFSDQFDENNKATFWDELTTPDIFDKDNPKIDSTGLWTWDESAFEESWAQLSKHLKEKRRFTITDEVLSHFIEFLPAVLETIEVSIPSKKILYRSRLGPGRSLKPYPCDKMGSPSPEKTIMGGRANPPNIPFLYLADDKETSILESRPWKGAYVSVAEFETARNLRIADLTIDLLVKHPFACGDELRFEVHARQVLKQLGDELSKPLHPQTKSIDYIPTQYLTEIVRNLGFDGMIYRSALGNGKNIVIFDQKKTECRNVMLYQVDFEIKLEMKAP